MPSMFVADTRERFQRRIDRLKPDSKRRWGTISASQMICHLSDQLRLALGERSARPIRSAFRYGPMRWFTINVMPWPHGTKGPPETFTTRPGNWESDIQTLRTLVERFGSSGAQTEWPDHPLFGTMTGTLWARLTCKHFDHHFRQFGV
jgi:Protein of unknown function (DUF1569)